MGKVGILGQDERVELIEGEIVTMPPIGPIHSGSVSQQITAFSPYIGSLFTLHCQSPVILGEHSTPQPDILLLKYRSDHYRPATPTPEDVLLLVEVCDTSISHDRAVKVPLYARYGIIETWLVNTQAHCLEVYRQPTAQGYQQSLTLRRGDTVTPVALPDLTLPVTDLLPPTPAVNPAV